jgi:endoglucanase Acf2
MPCACVQLLSRVRSSIVSVICLISLVAVPLRAQTVHVGAGSYTTTLPAGAAAPASQIFNTVAGPKPTHRFWAAKNWYADNIVNGAVTFGGGGGGPFNMFPQPLGMQTTARGLLMGFDAAVLNGGTFFNQPFEGDLTLGVAGLNTASVTVSSYTDWTVDFNFGPMTTRVGRGMPFVYVNTNGSNPTITFAGQPTVFANNGNILGVSIANNNYGLFCPSGGSWSGIGTTVLTCNLPAGRRYFSLALLPSQAALATYSQFAFSFPTNTQVTWNYNQNTSQVTTTYTVTTQAQEGTQTGFLMALYPHQYAVLQSGTINTSFTYPSSRGTLKVLQGVSFTTVNTFPGVLPFLPNTGNFSNTTLKSFIDAVANEPNHFSVSQSGGGTNSYDIGKDLGRVAQILPIAKVAGDTTALNGLQTSLQTELQNWFNGAANNQSTKVFYYNGNWGALIGYPAAFGSDIALNDHHFHYGYFIHASAILGLLNPSWIQPGNWGGMVNLLARDVAAPTRNDGLFPFMRHFDVYGGHSWASGQAPFGDGENQEASSEAVNAWTGMILFAVETGNTQLRDAAIWMYTQETNSIFDYWFNDGPVATFPPGFSRVEIANVFDGKGDTGTFFSGQIELEHGIEFLPFHGGSLYLGRDPAYVQRNLAEVTSIDPNAFAAGSQNWPDLMEEYEALADPVSALNHFNNTSFVFDGESKAHEYYWIANLQALGRVDETVTANTPLYRVFKTATGVRTHAAFNPGSSAMSVNFSDGATLTIPGGSMASEFGVVTVGGGAGPSAVLSANSLAFGNQNVGTVSAAKTLTLTNNGPGVLTIASIAVTGDFSQTNNCGASLAANAGCAINVSFKPTAAGSRTGTLTVSDNASSNPQTASLSGTGVTQGPAAPSNLTATAVSASQINLSWTASSTSGVTYNIYRSTSSGFAISPANRIATGIGATTFSDTGLSASTTFFYLATAVNANGESVASNQASATTQAGGGIPNGPISINSGGGASGTFVADTGFSGGSAVSSNATINVALIPTPVPPQAVYQTGRSGPSTYTIGGFTPGSSHQVQLHFAEIVFTSARQRAFNIIINGATVLNNFDIIANAGAANKAIEENFAATANSNGQIVIQFTVGSAGTPLINGVKVQ